MYSVYVQGGARGGAGGDCVEVETVNGGSRAYGWLWSIYIK